MDVLDKDRWFYVVVVLYGIVFCGKYLDVLLIYWGFW